MCGPRKREGRLAEFENIGAIAATEDNLFSDPRQFLDVFALPEKVERFSNCLGDLVPRSDF